MAKRLFLLLLLMVSFSLTGCSPGAASPGELAGNIAIAGSTSMQPLAEKLANAFMAENPKVAITVQGGGTDAGIKSVNEDVVDIGMASRELTPEEAALKKYSLAHDGIAIVVSPQNIVNNLSKTQLKDIFAGRLTNWSAVGGANKEIHVVTREAGSGTAVTFEEYVMLGEPLTRYAILEPSSGALRQTLSDEQAIAFLSFGYLDKDVKALSLDGVTANRANMKNGTYPLVRPFYFLTGREPDGAVKAFLDFCTGAEGQKIVDAEGYLTVK